MNNVLTNGVLARESVNWAIHVLGDKEQFTAWLAHQIRSEFTAAERIRVLHREYREFGLILEAKMLDTIVKDEVNHGNWLAQLYSLIAGKPYNKDEVSAKESPYWNYIQEDQTWEETIRKASLMEIAAYGYHAEELRLYRLMAIVGLTVTTSDNQYAAFCGRTLSASMVNMPLKREVCETFTKILHDEFAHVMMFGFMTNDMAIERTRGRHKAAATLLGLHA